MGYYQMNTNNPVFREKVIGGLLNKVDELEAEILRLKQLIDDRDTLIEAIKERNGSEV